MLDENNFLLTAVSDEECATVCGGIGLILNPDGTYSLDIGGPISGQSLQQNGTNVSVVGFSFTPIISVGLNSAGQTFGSGITSYTLFTIPITQ